MRVVGAGVAPSGQVLVPGRTSAEVLVDAHASGDSLAVTKLVIPAGGKMPEHDHGASASLLVLLAGEVIMTTGSRSEHVTPGMIVLVDRGERVQLANRAAEAATLIAVFTPGTAAAGMVATCSQGAAPAAARGSHWINAGPVDQLNDNAAVHADLAGHPVCLARSGGIVHALLDECSHEQVALSEGEVDNGHIECWLHGSRFALSTGAPSGPPATRPVPVYPVRISGGDIEVFLPGQPKEAP